MSDRSYPSHAIAVIGMAARIPGAADIDAFWRNLMDGVDVLEPFSDADLAAAHVPPELTANPAYVRAGTVLEGADMFDAAFFGISPREAQILDPQQRIFLECAWEALENAGYARNPSEHITGVYAGCGINTYFLSNVLSDHALVEAVGAYQIMLASDKDFLCTRASYKLDLRGPSMTIQTACSTSLVAVVEACRALERRECDMALAGGASVRFPQRAGYLYEEGMILSPDGRCRPFDVSALGTRPGAGAGIVVLKRLKDALADGDAIHAIIRGGAVNNDGAAKAGFTAPSVDGQIDVIATALARADVSPRSIGFIEAFGTGTPLGDPIEIAALTRVYRGETDDVGFCRLGSAKANLGHLDAAAGVAGFIKGVLAVERAEIPPLVHFTTPNPALALETSPFRAEPTGGAWTGDEPRRAGVSSFGIGGTNAHVVIEEPPPRTPSRPVREDRLLCISARTPEALDTAASNLAAWMGARPEQNLADIEWTLAVGRRDFAHRRAITADSAAQAVERLCSGAGVRGRHDTGARPVVFLFSGQGSQHPRMGAGLYRADATYRDAFDACVEGLKSHMHGNLRDIVFDGDEAALEQTAITQPALFAVEYALAAMWRAWGVTPVAMLGHGIGEYAAACLAGVFSLQDALKIVAARGRAMQACAPEAMAAVPLSRAALTPHLGGGVEIAAETEPNLCAVSGPAAAVEALIARLAATGAEARPLQVSHAFHSEVMTPAMAPLRAAFEDVALHPPRVPYVSNVTGAWITPEQAASPDYYAQHLRAAVRFSAGLEALAAAQPSSAILEVGPGASLAALARGALGREASQRVTASSPDPKDGLGDVEAALIAAGRLWTMGALAEPAKLGASEELRRVPLPTYPFERQRYWVEPVAQSAATPRVTTFAQPHAFGLTWSRREGRLATSAVAGRWLVVGGEAGCRSAAIGALKAAGAAPEAIAVSETIGDPAGVAGAIALFPLQRTGVEAALTIYNDLVSLAEQLETWDRPGPARILVAGQGLARVLDEQSPDPYGATAYGPVLVLPRECPGLELRHVDLETTAPPEVAAAILAHEAADDAPAAFVAWRHGRRFVRGFEAISTEGAAAGAMVKPGAVVLIPGGLGAIGFALAKRLARTAQAKLILTSRRPSEVLAASAVKEIREAGGDALVLAADLSDRDAMARAIGEGEARFGPVTAVFHAAGGATSGAIAFFKDNEDIHSVIDVKTVGLQVLVDLLGDRPLDQFVAMSSINGVIGAASLSDYCAADAVLDAFVGSALKPKAWKRALAVGWGPWRDIGMAARVVERLAHATPDVAALQRSQQIPPEAALELLEILVASDRTHAVVAMADITALEVDRPTAPPPALAQQARRPEGAAALEALQGETEIRLSEIWRVLLGAEEIGATDDFLALGGHSLLATRIIARISEQFGARLSLRDVFEAPTIRTLAKRIDDAKVDDEREELVL